MTITITRVWLLDTLERTLAGAVLSFVGALILTGTGVLSLSALHSAEVAGLTGGLVVLKSALAGLFTNTVSPASLAPTPAPPAATRTVPRPRKTARPHGDRGSTVGGLIAGVILIAAGIWLVAAVSLVGGIILAVIGLAVVVLA